MDIKETIALLTYTRNKVDKLNDQLDLIDRSMGEIFSRIKEYFLKLEAEKEASLDAQTHKLIDEVVSKVVEKKHSELEKEIREDLKRSTTRIKNFIDSQITQKSEENDGR